MCTKCKDISKIPTKDTLTSFIHKIDIMIIKVNFPGTEINKTHIRDIETMVIHSQHIEIKQQDNKNYFPDIEIVKIHSVHTKN
jgi:hypothetical protein